MSSWIMGLRYSARRLIKARGFFLTVTLMLTLGIGSITGIFSLLEGVLLRPLPFHDPNRLVQLEEHAGENPGLALPPAISGPTRQKRTRLPPREHCEE